MNDLFYNGKYTVILPIDVNYDFPDYIDVYSGTYDDCLFNITQYELSNDTFYTGNIIVNNISLIDDIIFGKLLGLDFTENNLYTRHINNSGIDSECYVSDSIMVCNSFILPIILNSKRSNNNIYGDCISHRINIKPITILSKELI